MLKDVAPNLRGSTQCAAVSSVREPISVALQVPLPVGAPVIFSWKTCGSAKSSVPPTIAARDTDLDAGSKTGPQATSNAQVASTTGLLMLASDSPSTFDQFKIGGGE